MKSVGEIVARNANQVVCYGRFLRINLRLVTSTLEWIIKKSKGLIVYNLLKVINMIMHVTRVEPEIRWVSPHWHRDSLASTERLYWQEAWRVARFPWINFSVFLRVLIRLMAGIAKTFSLSIFTVIQSRIILKQLSIVVGNVDSIKFTMGQCAAKNFKLYLSEEQRKFQPSHNNELFFVLPCTHSLPSNHWHLPTALRAHRAASNGVYY